MNSKTTRVNLVLTGDGPVGQVPARSASRRLIFVDLLNVVSCFAVVALHVSLPVFSPAPTRDWVGCVGFQACFIFAVPVFFMISGMNLLGYRNRYSTKDFFFKRLRRVGGALVGGSLLCYLLFGVFPERFYGADQIAASFSLEGFLKSFVTNGINSVYWFLYEILYLYLLTPLLSLTLGHRKLIRYLLILCFVAGFCTPLLEWVGVPAEYFAWLVNWPFFASPSLFYYLLGGYIGTYFHRPNRRGTACSFLAYAVSAAAMFLWALLVNGYPACPVNVYVSFPISISSPLCIVQSVSIFMFAVGIEKALRNHARLQKLIVALSKSALGVYLVHIVFINLLPIGRVAAFVTWMSRSKLLKLIVVWLCSVLVSLSWSRIKGWFFSLASVNGCHR